MTPDCHSIKVYSPTGLDPAGIPPRATVGAARP